MEERTNITQTEARQRFLRIAPQRMRAVLKRLEMLMPLAGPGYVSQRLEEQKIIDTLRGHVDALDRKFVEKRTPKPVKPRKPRVPRVAKPKPSFSFDHNHLFEADDVSEPQPMEQEHEYR